MCLTSPPTSPAMEANATVYKWAYVMVRMHDVAHKLRPAALASSINAALAIHPDVYNIFNYINISGTPPHILVGMQDRQGIQKDLYILLGFYIPSDTDFEYSTVVPQELDAYLARPNMSLGVIPANCLFLSQTWEMNGEDKAFARWCKGIVRDCEDVAETGMALF